MDPVVSLKRSTPVSSELCIICQESKHDALFDATPQGLNSMRDATESRKKVRDVKYRDATDRLTTLFEANSAPVLVWHKSCYAIYTSKEKIQRLKKKYDQPLPTQSEGHTSSGSHCRSAELRSQTKPIDWKLCMFCQGTSIKQKTCNVMSNNMSNQILSAAKYVEHIHIRVADVNDLMAAEGCYHPNCLKKFLRDSAKAKVENKSFDLAMVWLAQQLRQSADEGHVLELEQVWLHYKKLADEAGIEIPRSFISRPSTFKEKLSTLVNDIYEFIVLHDQSAYGKQTILLPIKFRNIPFSEWYDQDLEEGSTTIPVFKPPEDDFLSMVHVALKLRSDILSQPSYNGVDVSKDAEIDCVPPSVYMFIHLLLGGQSLLELDPEENDDELGDEEEESHKRTRVLSIAQDLVYSVSGGKKITPKHVGLGLTLHQATRSKKLVEMFHNAGHTISYKDILRIDTALAENTLQHMDRVTGAVVPPNLVSRRFVHFSADNIDINDATLDGKNTFHATQIAVWQRGPEHDNLLKSIEPSKRTTLIVPEAMEAIIPSHIAEGTTEPHLPEVQAEWFDNSINNSNTATIKAAATDMAFMLERQHEEPRPTWTSFNQKHSHVDPEQSIVGYLPIIQAPAHDIDTLNTVVKRILHITASVQQKHAVVTVDQALFPALMELKWANPKYKDVLIPQLGGLHVSMNFLKILGQHTQDVGLAEVWIESGLMGPNSTEKALTGKSYAKGIRAHKLTVQALWQLLIPQLLEYLEELDQGLKDDIENAVRSNEPDDYSALIAILASAKFRTHLSTFAQDQDPNFQFWWQYMNMVCILLRFIRAQRDGLWDLHVVTFRQMLPYFHRYDHTNYARWGCVYLAEMQTLPDEVKDEFLKGNFVVKGSDQRFNQVSPDHSQEWLNGTGKKGGGIVGITKTTSALSRWALSYNLRACIAKKTRALFHVGSDDQIIHNEATKGRMKRDSEDEDNIKSVLQRFKVFSPEARYDVLHNIATKDLATIDIQQSLLNAEELGQVQLMTFVKERLIIPEDGHATKKFRDPLQKSKALTFSSLYETKKDSRGKESIMKADRNILQRLITAYQAGRKVNLHTILKHELMPVPISIAYTNGSLRTGNKAVLVEAMTQDVTCPAEVTIDGTSCLVIDGQALVVSLGKPAGITNFGELADAFVKLVMHMGRCFDRIDVTFDRYRDTSIKADTRMKRSKHARLIRRVVEDGSVPVPHNWKDFLAMPENKADLACFLSNHLIKNAPTNKTIVVAGGFQREDEVQTSNHELDIQQLQANHEEADTRLVLHCVHTNAKSVVVSARDTDVLVLLVAHFHKMACTKLWMKAGTSKHQKYIPVHDIQQALQFTQPVFEALIPFHAVTGCDTVSYFAEHGKKRAWKVFITDNHLVKDLGRGELTPTKMKNAEKFVCKLYGVPESNSCDQARVKLFCKFKTQETLPPTTDALQFHIQRAHYQSMVWNQAANPQQVLPSPETLGWTMDGGQLSPQLTSLGPIPESCKNIVSCGCTKGCTSLNCTCRKGKLVCTVACKCIDSSIMCRNKID